MPNARARTHTLSISRTNNRARPQAIFVLEFPFENVIDDFHVLMRRGGKTFPSRNPILVDHSQRAEAHELGIVVSIKRKSVMGIEPAIIAAAPLFTAPNVDHCGILVITTI